MTWKCNGPLLNRINHPCLVVNLYTRHTACQNASNLVYHYRDGPQAGDPVFVLSTSKEVRHGPEVVYRSSNGASIILFRGNQRVGKC